MPGFPSHVWRKAVCALPIPAAQKVVLIRMAEYADYHTGRDAWPGRDALARDCCVSPSVVDRARRNGRKHGVVEQTAGGHKGANPVYRLTLPKDVSSDNQRTSVVTSLPTPRPTPLSMAGQQVRPDRASLLTPQDTRPIRPGIDSSGSHSFADGSEASRSEASATPGPTGPGTTPGLLGRVYIDDSPDSSSVGSESSASETSVRGFAKIGNTCSRCGQELDAEHDCCECTCDPCRHKHHAECWRSPKCSPSTVATVPEVDPWAIPADQAG